MIFILFKDSFKYGSSLALLLVPGRDRRCRLHIHQILQMLYPLAQMLGIRIQELPLHVVAKGRLALAAVELPLQYLQLAHDGERTSLLLVLRRREQKVGDAEDRRVLGGIAGNFLKLGWAE